MLYLVHLLSSSESMDINSLASLDDLLQSVHQFEVLGTELIDQRIGLFDERLDRLSIGVLLNRFDLIFELA